MSIQCIFGLNKFLESLPGILVYSLLVMVSEIWSIHNFGLNKFLASLPGIERI